LTRSTTLGRRASNWSSGRGADPLPHAHSTATYVNSLHDYDADRVRASNGPAKYHRLAQVKAAYDPGNVFHRNPNINPAD
jgi:FAD/FMN-containing dehydrogenase